MSWDILFEKGFSNNWIQVSFIFSSLNHHQNHHHDRQVPPQNGILDTFSSWGRWDTKKSAKVCSNCLHFNLHFSRAPWWSFFLRICALLKSLNLIVKFKFFYFIYFWENFNLKGKSHLILKNYGFQKRFFFWLCSLRSPMKVPPVGNLIAFE